MSLLEARVPSSAEFTVTGSAVVNVSVKGVIDRGAVRGFDAVVDWLVGSPEVVIDLRGCEAIDGAGRDGLHYSVDRLRRAGAAVSVMRPPSRAGFVGNGARATLRLDGSQARRDRLVAYPQGYR
jgi:anti-anti-sigma regulatory factor